MRKIFILIVLFTSSQLLASGLPYEVTAENILKRVNGLGANEVVRELYDNRSAWSIVLSGIERGEDKWLDVGLSLEPGTDAGAASMLLESLGLGLEKNPVGVLSRFSSN